MICAAALALTACGGSDSKTKVVQASDVATGVEEETTVGVVLDQAMNSVLMRTLAGDSAYFSYPEALTPNRRCHSGVGDTITVKHVAARVTLVLPGAQN